MMRKGLGPEGAQESGLPQEAGSRFGLLGRAVGRREWGRPGLPRPPPSRLSLHPFHTTACSSYLGAPASLGTALPCVR